MVELRKRKTPPPAPAPAPKKERKTKATKANGKSEPVAEPAAPEPTAAPAPAPEAAPEPETKAAAGVPKPGDKIDLEGFGGEVETNDGRKVTLKALVEESKEGVVLFTYPKASTPGCRFLLGCHVETWRVLCLDTPFFADTIPLKAQHKFAFSEIRMNL